MQDWFAFELDTRRSAEFPDMATEIVEADVAVEEFCDGDGHDDLATDLIGLQVRSVHTLTLMHHC